jgi:hypothetical protein
VTAGRSGNEKQNWRRCRAVASFFVSTGKPEFRRKSDALIKTTALTSVARFD